MPIYACNIFKIYRLKSLSCLEIGDCAKGHRLLCTLKSKQFFQALPRAMNKFPIRCRQQRDISVHLPTGASRNSKILVPKIAFHASLLRASSCSAWMMSSILSSQFKWGIGRIIPLQHRCCLHSLQDFTMSNAKYRQYLESLANEYAQLMSERVDGGSINNSRFFFLEAVNAAVMELQKKYADLNELNSVVKGMNSNIFWGIFYVSFNVALNTDCQNMVVVLSHTVQ